MAEAIVFAYVGICAAYQWNNFERDLVFVGIGFFIVIIGRFSAIYLTYFLFSFFPGSKSNILTFPQLTFCSYAALIRGAIAFGLIQNLSEADFGRWVPNTDTKSDRAFKIIPEVEVVKSSVLYLVILTTIIMGGLTPPIQKCLLKPAKSREQIIHLHEESGDVPKFGKKIVGEDGMGE
jgi:hypothetical protein